MTEWKLFKIIPYSPFTLSEAPYNGTPFLVCIWGSWVGQAVYARHYDSGDRPPGKYEFFYVIEDVEKEAWKIRIETDPFPLTHWMPLPATPELA